MEELSDGGSTCLTPLRYAAVTDAPQEASMKPVALSIAILALALTAFVATERPQSSAVLRLMVDPEEIVCVASYLPAPTQHYLTSSTLRRL